VIEPLWECTYCGNEYQPERPDECKGCGGRRFKRVVESKPVMIMESYGELNDALSGISSCSFDYMIGVR